MVRLVRISFSIGTTMIGQSAAAQLLLQALAGIAAGDQHGQGFAAEGVDHARCVDAAAARPIRAWN